MRMSTVTIMKYMLIVPTGDVRTKIGGFGLALSVSQSH
jgi:hypothetical protein